MTDVAPAVCADVRPEQPSLLAQLRAATAECHRRLEQNPRMLELMSSRLTLARYGELLRLLWVFHTALEPALMRALQPAPTIWEPQPGSRLRWLQSDLQVLGLPVPDPACAEVAALPRLETFAAAVGALYVLEGSSLGGRLISRHLSQQLQLSPDTGMRFYHGYGDGTGAHWAAFRQSLEQRSWCDRQCEEAAAAAVSLFESLDRWLGSEACAR